MKCHTVFKTPADFGSWKGPYI